MSLCVIYHVNFLLIFLFADLYIFFILLILSCFSIVLEAEEAVEKQVKDVQQLLDEMMVKTMKEVEEQPNEADSDLSGTEKIEEVICKEEKEPKEEVKLVDEKPDNERIKEKPPKVKPSDSETDTDNIKVMSFFLQL